MEISCHGSISVINKITKTLLKKQIRLAEPGEFTKRALMNDKLSVLEAETINDLVNAETENQRKIAIGNLSGNLDKLVNEISNKQKKLLADIEAIKQTALLEILEQSGNCAHCDLGEQRRHHHPTAFGGSPGQRAQVRVVLHVRGAW